MLLGQLLQLGVGGVHQEAEVLVRVLLVPHPPSLRPEAVCKRLLACSSAVASVLCVSQQADCKCLYTCLRHVWVLKLQLQSGPRFSWPVRQVARQVLVRHPGGHGRCHHEGCWLMRTAMCQADTSSGATGSSGCMQRLPGLRARATRMSVLFKLCRYQGRTLRKARGWYEPQLCLGVANGLELDPGA